MTTITGFDEDPEPIQITPPSAEEVVKIKQEMTGLPRQLYLYRQYCDEHMGSCWFLFEEGSKIPLKHVENDKTTYIQFTYRLEILGYYYAGHRAGMFRYRIRTPRSKRKPKFVDVGELNNVNTRRVRRKSKSKKGGAIESLTPIEAGSTGSITGTP